MNMKNFSPSSSSSSELQNNKYAITSNKLIIPNIRKFRTLMLLFVFAIVVFIFYANYSIHLKETVFAIYTFNYSLNGMAFLNISIVGRNYYDGMTTTTTTTMNASDECPLIPPNLGTRILVNTSIVLDFDAIETLFSQNNRMNLSMGGKHKPIECVARYRTAIIVPYRDRLDNLKLFLRHMHPFLVKQQLAYGIYVIEPEKGFQFNRGLLMNIGFKEAQKDDSWQCYTFHDVDLLPEDERNIYSCPEIPRHMSSAVSTLNYKLPYDSIFGGVTEFSKEHFSTVNGFSNLFFGWGGEDDDLRTRVAAKGYSVSRYPLEIGRYTMAAHEKDKPNPIRFKLLSTSADRMKKDGLSNLKYEVQNILKTKLFTKIVVSYNQSEIMRGFNLN